MWSLYEPESGIYIGHKEVLIWAEKWYLYKTVIGTYIGQKVILI